MTTMTAAEASRNFSAVLDRAENGETVTLTRHGRTVAVISPAPRRTYGDLRRRLEADRAAGNPPLDDDIEHDIVDGLAGATSEWSDPWDAA
jgi:prevent-host-death family protein